MIGVSVSRTREGERKMVTRVAILDDYQNIALKAADWTNLPPDVEITVFNQHIKGEQVVAHA